MRNPIKTLVWVGACCLAMAFSARATLTLTNGNFDAATTLDNPDIPGWFDGNHHPQGFWQDTWLASRALPSGQSGGTVGLSGGVGGQNFLYQSIGTRNPVDHTLRLSPSVGAFTDANSAGTWSGTLTVGLYEQTGSFTGANGTDIDGASGITQVGSSVALPITRVGGAGAVASDETCAFDISDVDKSHTLYLRFKWIPTGASFMSLDNASITTVDSPLDTAPFTLDIKRVVSAATFADGQTRVTVEFAGVPNRIYQIKYSTDMSLDSWSTLAPYRTGSTGTFEGTFTKPGDVAADWNARLFFRAVDTTAGGAVLSFAGLRGYVASFNSQRPDDTTVGLPGDGSVTAISNNQASAWMENTVPLFECSDKDIEEIYHFRWWTFRKHIHNTPDGFVVTEYLPQVGWSKKYNTINCPVGHQLYEGRWLRDPKIIDDYTRFYFGNGGDPGGTTKSYSNWITDGIHARYLVNSDKPFITGLLDALVRNHEDWKQDGAAGDAFQNSRFMDKGLYWQCDSWEGQEYSIGGSGIRPPINSYRFGDAMAITRIAELAGRTELADHYRAEAGQLRIQVQEQLWDPQANFFKVKRHELASMNWYPNTSAVACEPGQLANVREIFGLVPWYFNLPEGGRGYEDAWRQLIDPQGFQAPYGPTVAERRHPNFMINGAGCLWCGASWPFSTAQTLTALANVLNNYSQGAVGKQEYIDTLKTYTRSHRLTLGDGRVVPWIDESLNPDTGRWIMNGQFPNTLGRDYNHSTYCDLVITGLVGLRPRADAIVEVNPLVPEGALDYFCLDNVSYHGRNLTILWDKTGNRYGRGPGLRVLADGRVIAHSETLARVTGNLNGSTP